MSNHDRARRRRRSRLATPAVAIAVVLATMPFDLSASAGGASPRLWVSRFDGALHGYDFAQASALSPDGSVLYVTGRSPTNVDDGSDIATIAYDTSNGAELWSVRYDGPRSDEDAPADIDVSPDGSTVFVTGPSKGRFGLDFVTIAYDAASGSRRWVERFDGGANDTAEALGVAADGSTVFVAGGSIREGQRTDYLVLAYRAADGSVAWRQRYASPKDDYPASLAVGSGRLFVTGRSDTPAGDTDFLTVAYATSNGAVAWSTRAHEAGTDRAAIGIALGASGNAVFVTGEVFSDRRRSDFLTVSYAAGTGAKRWTQGYAAPGNAIDTPSALVVTPGSSRVVVTGASQGKGGDFDFLTLAYGAASGARVWTTRTDAASGGTNYPYAMTPSPDGASVYVVGVSDGFETEGDYEVVAYGTNDGSRSWRRRFNGAVDGTDTARDVQAGPAGDVIFVTGTSSGSGTFGDYATVAFVT